MASNAHRIGKYYLVSHKRSDGTIDFIGEYTDGRLVTFNDINNAISFNTLKEVRCFIKKVRESNPSHIFNIVKVDVSIYNE